MTSKQTDKQTNGVTSSLLELLVTAKKSFITGCLKKVKIVANHSSYVYSVWDGLSIVYMKLHILDTYK